MGAKYEDLRTLMLQVALKKPPQNYTLEQAENALRKELKELAKDYNAFRRNKLTIYELIQSVVDEVLPNRVVAALGRFAEIKQFGQGDKPIFKKKLGRQRGKQFVTQVGLSGIYETFRLDSTYLEVTTKAHGGAAIIEFERFLDGLETLDELMWIIQMGLEDQMFNEVQNALIAAIQDMPNANIHTGASFSEAAMVKLINVAKAYGPIANIFCTPEFAGTITSSGNFGTAGGYSLTEQQEMRDVGHLGVFRSANVISLPQSFLNADNVLTVLNPGTAYVIPGGGSGDEKIVKIAMEGNTIVDDYKNADRSLEIQLYKKFGVAVLTTNYYCVYQNTALYSGTGHSAWVSPFGS